MTSGIILETDAARGRAKRVANREGGLLARLSALRLRNRTRVEEIGHLAAVGVI